MDMGKECKFTNLVLEKNLNAFIHTHVGDVYYELLKTNDRLSEIKYEKAIIRKEILSDCNSLNLYEELENEYITILTEEIYKQALCDFVEAMGILNR